MILVIRIAGMVNNPKAVQETLHRMRLRRKYAAVILQDTPENRKTLLKVRNYVAYGTASDALLEELITIRGKSEDGKPIDAKAVIKQLATKRLEELGIKPFFRLHPPRGGIDSKKHVGVHKGVLGDHKDAIGKLVERML